MNGTLVKNARVAKPAVSRQPRTTAASRWLATLTSSPARWAAVSCVLLGISGGIRLWLDWKNNTLAANEMNCPFPLETLPRELGTWRAIDQKDGHLEPDIARIAGSKADLIRGYQDETTGDVALVLVLFGAARDVFAHNPDICLPANGFQQRAEATDEALLVPGSEVPARFRKSLFSKKAGAIIHTKAVVHTYLHNKEWLPEVSDRWKMFRSHPAMFRVQVERMGGGLALEHDPNESLLKELIVEINRRVADKKGS